MESGGQSLPRDDRAASRSRSPARAVSAGNVRVGQAVSALMSRAVGHSMGSLAEWDGHFDGRVRPFRHGFVLGVADALWTVPIGVALFLSTPFLVTKASVATAF